MKLTYFLPRIIHTFTTQSSSGLNPLRSSSHTCLRTLFYDDCLSKTHTFALVNIFILKMTHKCICNIGLLHNKLIPRLNMKYQHETKKKVYVIVKYSKNKENELNHYFHVYLSYS